MGRRAGLLFLLFIFSLSTFATGELRNTGSRSGALGGASVALSDGWSAANNPAGMVWQSGFLAGLDLKNQFLVKELCNKLFLMVVPAGKSRFGLVVQHYGYSLWYEMNVGITYAMKLGKKFSAGIRIDYYRIAIAEGYGSKNAFSFRVGLQYQPGEKFTIGCLVANPYPVKLTQDFPDYLATTFQSGIVWKLSKQLLSSIEIEKDLIHDPVLKAGIEYHLAKPLFTRIGFSTSPARFSFGFGVEMKKLKFDLSTSYHPVLGYSPQVSLIYHCKP